MDSNKALKELKDELGQLKDNIKKAFSESGGEISDKTKEVLNNAADRLKVQVERAVQEAKKEKVQVDDYVKEHPWKIAGIALAVGAFFGMMFRGRRD